MNLLVAGRDDAGSDKRVVLNFGEQQDGIGRWHNPSPSPWHSVKHAKGLDILLPAADADRVSHLCHLAKA